MSPALKTLAVGVCVVVLGVVVLKLPSDLQYLVLFGGGLLACAVVVYQLYHILREDAFEDLGYAGGRREEFTPSVAVTPPPPITVGGLPREEAIIIEWAQDCLNSGKSLEAGLKLEKIAPNYRAHPEVLKVRYEIFRRENRWHAALDVAQAFCRAVPDKVFGWIAQAESLHRLKLTKQAMDQLLLAVPKFPREPLIPFNLARFTCELGRLDESRRWLQRALTLGDTMQIAALAMAESDLDPLLHHLARKALVEKILSGGHKGAERAALDFALSHGIPCGGWCARPRTNEEDYVLTRYKLSETPNTGYRQGTEWNVRDSDGTVIFSISEELSGAPVRTMEFVHQYAKPSLHLHRTKFYENPATKLLEFIEQNKIRVLHVAGSSPSKEAQVADFVKEVLEQAYLFRVQHVLIGANTVQMVKGDSQTQFLSRESLPG
jgi:tetratricopeptide (TPR) repeat protein